MNEKEQQIHSQTRALLSKYTDEQLTDDAILEVENNFKEFFQILLEWHEDDVHKETSNLKEEGDWS